MLKIVLQFHNEAKLALEEGATLEPILKLPIREKIAKAKYILEKDLSKFDDLEEELKSHFKALVSGRVPG
jgi:V/A-type H+-transporting ATPase subunit A